MKNFEVHYRTFNHYGHWLCTVNVQAKDDYEALTKAQKHIIKIHGKGAYEVVSVNEER